MRKSTALLLLATAVLAAATFWLWRDRAEMRARSEALQARLDAVERRPAAAGPGVAAVEPTTTGTVGQAEPGAEAPVTEDYGDFERKLLQDPAYREARRRFRQLELMSGHLDLAKALGIPPEKAEQLIALLLERELHYLSENNLNPRDEEERRARQLKNEQAQRDQDAELVALLGVTKFAEWKDYHASLQVRHEVHQLGASLFANGVPLREDQIEPLISAIQAERARVRQELAEYTESLAWSGGAEAKSHRYRDERRVELGREVNEGVHAAASAILSKSQLAVLDDYLRRQLELQDAQFRMREAQAIWLRVNAADD